jgi:alkylation response protein AidB-like acyl-CoA dehydrogenase
MRFGYSDEQEQFRAIVARFLRERSPPSEVRKHMASADGYERTLWQQLAGELGLTGVHVPESFGGQGFGYAELGIALEEMGQALFCAPYFASSVLATEVLLNIAAEAEQHELLPALVSGERIATLAWVEHGGRWDVATTTLTAHGQGDACRLDGHKKYVLDGHHADLLLVVARTRGSVGDAGLGVYAVDAHAAGVERRQLTTIDTTRRQAEIRFTDTPARRLGATESAALKLRQSLDRATIALACEMVGGARALLNSAVEYAKLRMQFGRPIGSFQAIKHKCAEMLLEVELATSAARYAAAAIDEQDKEVPALASLAKAMASDAYMRAAIECLQIHGGIGFTWDEDTHLWFKRAKSSEVMLGDAHHHRERYLALTEASA